jgi:1-phosphofructokinase/tagatose 6-phosphate kinase
MTASDGCFASVAIDGGRRVFRARVLPREPVATVGSGDAFLAGLVAARYQGLPAADALRQAVACGAESTQHFGAGVIDRREVERLVPEVQVEQLDDVQGAGSGSGSGGSTRAA